ncbi:hypothetical protein [Nocardia terpenica]|uniref:hypothetical protein n=1 Tax=Nocardia terpenica TaxID=455432 RepID=UPI0002F9E287|nr:hypothetical protein [Nocardia terpenica]NQE86648.1 hypothetical protein [Nocardia terpenica]
MMLLPNLHGDTVIVWRRPARDRFGDTSYVEHHTIPETVIEYGSQDEPNANGAPTADRELARYDVTLYCPVGADVLANDLIELPDGDQYHVVGRPQRPKHPVTGWTPGVVVRLRRIEG